MIDRSAIHHATAVFRALSDRTRLEIIRLLLEHGELYQKRLIMLAGCRQPSISRHLAYLERAGLVACRRSGRFAYWRLTAIPGPVCVLLRRLADLGAAGAADELLRACGPTAAAA
jgi:ArsR family transcriptional regulator